MASPYLNKVLLIGNLTRDPVVKFTPSGRPVCEMRLAMNRRYKTNQGEEREETCFLNVAVWDKQGETCGRLLTKGEPVFVEGRLQYDEWEKDGRKSSMIRVLADRVQFLGGRRRPDDDDGGQPNPGTPGGGAPRPPSPDTPTDSAPADAGDDEENLPF